MKLGINASRARSGGARAHLIGILAEGEPAAHGFAEVHVWSYRELLDALPDLPWLIKHCPPETEQSILRQLWWERFSLPKQLKANQCNILLNVDAGTVCRFRPAVTMSRDMLSYELGEMQRYGWSKARLRLLAIKYLQNASLRTATGAIFLTKHAARVIQQSCGALRRIAYIPHGVGENFQTTSHQVLWPQKNERPVRCLYVSNIAPYKHQWHVVRAVKLLRDRGFDLQLILTGGGKAGASSEAQLRLEREISCSDPERAFIGLIGFVRQEELPDLLAKSDVFIFASSCENMPNTLVEAMAVGLPIACSNRGPMPEVLREAGVFFDPENPEAIAQAIAKIITNEELRFRIATQAKELSRQYSWTRCADETLGFLSIIAKEKTSGLQHD